MESSRADPEADRTDPWTEPVLDPVLPDSTEADFLGVLMDLLALIDGGSLPGGWSGGDDCGVFSAMMIQMNEKQTMKNETESYLQTNEVVINSVYCGDAKWITKEWGLFTTNEIDQRLQVNSV